MCLIVVICQLVNLHERLPCSNFLSASLNFLDSSDDMLFFLRFYVSCTWFYVFFTFFRFSPSIRSMFFARKLYFIGFGHLPITYFQLAPAVSRFPGSHAQPTIFHSKIKFFLLVRLTLTWKKSNSITECISKESVVKCRREGGMDDATVR